MAIVRIFWFIIGFSALGLAFIGVFLPVLPTVPFLLLAAFGFSKSSDRLHNWLINHKIFGPPINEWRLRGAISRRVKFYASLSMLFSVALTLWLSVAMPIVGFQVAALTIVALFIWSRPES